MLGAAQACWAAAQPRPQGPASLLAAVLGTAQARWVQARWGGVRAQWQGLAHLTHHILAAAGGLETAVLGMVAVGQQQQQQQQQPQQVPMHLR